jgi:ComF family protein
VIYARLVWPICRAMPTPVLAAPCHCRSTAPDCVATARRNRRFFDRAFAPFRYQPPLDALIKTLKFGGRLANARLLGDLFATALVERGGPWPDCIAPTPLHPRRLRERGFNQALELARTVARRLRIPLQPSLLRRIRYTLPQTQLDAYHRQTNPLGAFALGHSLPGTHIALIDDVITTASTISECARVLHSGGAITLEVWAISRASADP